MTPRLSLLDRWTRALECSSAQYRKAPVQYLLVILFVLVVFCWAWTAVQPALGNSFSPDSYACFLLGQNVFEGRGFTTFAVRDVHEKPVWPLPSRSFAPAYPVLVGFVDWLTGSGMNAGILANLAILAATLLAVAVLGRSLVRGYWPLLALSYVFFYTFSRWYRDEVSAARSIPLSILFFVMFLLAFVKSLDRQRTHRHSEVLCGLSLCLLTMTRFEQSLFCLAAMPSAYLGYRAVGFSTRESRVKTGRIAATFAIGCMPWMIRNLVVFGTPFATNHTLAVKLIFDGLANGCFWVAGATPQTVFDNPGLWLARRLGYLGKNWARVTTCTAGLNYLAPVIAVALWSRLSRVHQVIVALCGVQIALNLLAVSITPYHDDRYWSQIHLSLCLIAALSLLGAVRSANPGFGWVALATVAIAGTLMASLERPDAGRALHDYLLKGKLIPRDLAPERRYVAATMAHYRPFMRKDALVSPSRQSEAFTYFTGLRTVVFPLNLTDPLIEEAAFFAWLEKWRIDYLFVYAADEGRFRSLLTRDYVVASRPGVDYLLDARRVLRDQALFHVAEGP